MAARWEWRTFACEGRPAVTALRSSATAIRASEEWYVVGEHSRQNVKVRQGVLEVKALQREEPGGLQLWQPVLKVPFPVDAADVRVVAAHLGVPALPLDRLAYSMDEWLSEVALRTPGLTIVRVRKTRHGSTVDECLVEVADLVMDNLPVVTIAVESEDPDRVRRTVTSLGLDACPPEDYVTAIKRLTTSARDQA
jgi:exopolyphosphatase/guanosine-5'-triphosphate,3'-diphosphate pyrophosphatase